MAFKLLINRQEDRTGASPVIEHDCREPIISIGSDPAATISLSGAGIAAEQAIILLEDDALLLINRAGGTRLNDEPLKRETRCPLASGDKLQFAGYRVIVQNSAEVNSTSAPSNSSPQSSTFNPATNGAPAPVAKEFVKEKPRSEGKNFAAILDSLRTEEDSFYFHIESGTQAGIRLLIDKPETPCGWDLSGTSISLDAAEVVAPRMMVRKDWTGVVVHALSSGMMNVNGDAMNEPRRLRNGDRVTLAPPADMPSAPPVRLLFHEPASLVALDTMLPQPLPPPVPIVTAMQKPETDVRQGLAAVSSLPDASSSARRLRLDSNKRYFGFFTLLELGIMAIATAIAAVIIFLVLEYSA